ncbi:MAG: hypothetical protein ACJAR3_002215 [Roseivirga sp.]|jgi:hypothetical protein
MIDLSKSQSRDLKALSKRFYKSVKTELETRLTDAKPFLNNPVYNTSSGEPLGDYLEDNIESIITDPLSVLLHKYEPELKGVFDIYYRPTNQVATVFKKKIIKVLFFEEYHKWKAYRFTKELDINCCPYCNRTYITTLGTDKKKFSRPDIDHFLPKIDYGYLRFSFFNLIPSCVICNRNAKGRKSTSLDGNYYPYSEGFGRTAKFIYIPAKYKGFIGEGSPRIDWKYAGSQIEKDKAAANIKLFKLTEQYTTQVHELNHLLNLKQAHSDAYIENLMIAYPGLIKNEKEAYLLAFGKEFDHVHDDKQPLSKFTRDILEDIGMLSKLNMK